jgi:hypothetical protein
MATRATQPKRGAVTKRKPITGPRVLGPPTAQGRRTGPRAPGSPRPEGTLRHAAGMKVTLSRKDGLTPLGLLIRPFRFQLPPLEEFSVSYGHEWNDTATLGGEQISRKGARQLQQINFQTLVLDWEPTWAVLEGGPSPLEATETLKEICQRAAIVRLRVSNMALWGEGVYEVDQLVTLRSLEVSEKAGELDARYFNLQFTEWERPQLATRTLGKRTPGKRQSNRQHAIGTLGHLNDTLYSVSAGYYGSYRYWKFLALVNGIGDWHPAVPISRRVPKVFSLKIPPKPVDERQARRVVARET